MNKLDPKKLSVEFRGATATRPRHGRRYTLTHSDLTGKLFLTIGTQYAYDKVGLLRDEVLAEWRWAGRRPLLWVEVLVAGPMTLRAYAALRYRIFRSKLPLALEAIRYGDRKFFATYPALDQAPLLVAFRSSHPAFQRVEHWGRPADYQYQADRRRRAPRKLRPAPG